MSARRRLVLLILWAVGLLSDVAIAIDSLVIRRMHRVLGRLSRAVDYRCYEDRVERFLEVQSEISAKAGYIQFLKSGYSIRLESVDFTQDGLELSGYFGNPKNIRMHTVALNLTAYERPSSEEYKELGFMEQISYPPQIGSGQSTPILLIAPEEERYFELTVANVRQTREGCGLYASLSGVGHSYR